MRNYGYAVTDLQMESNECSVLTRKMTINWTCVTVV